jgi:hypothetical protein
MIPFTQLEEKNIMTYEITEANLTLWQSATFSWNNLEKNIDLQVRIET